MPRPAAPKPTHIRQRAIEAAFALFLERGFAEVGTREIATAAGLANGSLYHEFPGGKAEIAAEVYARIVAELVQVIQGTSSKTGGNAGKADALAELIHDVARWAETHPRHLNLYLCLQCIADEGALPQAVRAGAVEMRGVLRSRLVSVATAQALNSLPGAVLTEVVLGPTLRTMAQMDHIVADGGAVATIIPRLVDAASGSLRGVAPAKKR